MCRYNADLAKKTGAVPMASVVGDPVTSNSKALSTLLMMGPADLGNPNPPQCPAQAAGTRPTCENVKMCKSLVQHRTFLIFRHTVSKSTQCFHIDCHTNQQLLLNWFPKRRQWCL